MGLRDLTGLVMRLSSSMIMKLLHASTEMGDHSQVHPLGI